RSRPPGSRLRACGRGRPLARRSAAWFRAEPWWAALFQAVFREAARLGQGAHKRAVAVAGGRGKLLGGPRRPRRRAARQCQPACQSIPARGRRAPDPLQPPNRRTSQVPTRPNVASTSPTPSVRTGYGGSPKTPHLNIDLTVVAA